MQRLSPVCGGMYERVLSKEEGFKGFTKLCLLQCCTFPNKNIMQKKEIANHDQVLALTHTKVSCHRRVHCNSKHTLNTCVYHGEYWSDKLDNSTNQHNMISVFSEMSLCQLWQNLNSITDTVNNPVLCLVHPPPKAQANAWSKPVLLCHGYYPLSSS